MRVGQRVDQLHIDPHLVVHFLNAAFEDVRYIELFCDVTQVGRRAFEFLGRRARDHFQVSDLCQPCEDFILHALCEKRIVGIAA